MQAASLILPWTPDQTSHNIRDINSDSFGLYKDLTGWCSVKEQLVLLLLAEVQVVHCYHIVIFPPSLATNSVGFFCITSHAVNVIVLLRKKNFPQKLCHSFCGLHI